MDVESPYEGVLLEWLAPVDTILPIGGEVARMEVGSEAPVAAPSLHNAVAAPAASSESVVGVRIPQIGEGLQEARLVAVLKQPGDYVRTNMANIYQYWIGNDQTARRGSDYHRSRSS